MNSEKSRGENGYDFDEEVDIVVVGYGYAGGITAIEAADGGAQVLLSEKMPDPGGISICSGGALRCAHDADEALAYLRATCGGRTPDDVLQVLADGLAEAEDYLRGLAQGSGAVISTREKGGNYPFPGVDTFYHTNVDDLPGVDESYYPHVCARPSANGWRLFKVLEDNVARRKNIDVRFEMPAQRLISNGRREVLGVIFETKDGPQRVKARRGVVLACGGFEANEEMKRQYWEKVPVLTATSRANTGDGIRMAQDLGAELWHMWHYHGAYGFKHPDPGYPVAIRVKRLPDWMPGREATAGVKMVWILVDQYGRRYMNECTPYTQDTSHRRMEFCDTATQSFPRIPSHMIFDEEGRNLYQIGAPTYNERGIEFRWSEDNLKEVEMGILKRADSVEELAQVIKAEPTVLTATLERWNKLCQGGKDDDYGRPQGTMMSISRPPFYTGRVWPVVSNTQGGPVHNAKQQILSVYAEPIARLYAAGELGSAFGHLYLSGGNITECFITGRVAGRQAAALAPWE